MTEGRQLARERGRRALVALVEITARALGAGQGALLWAGAVDAVARALDANGCALWELLPDGDTLVLRAATQSDRALAAKLDAAASAGAREVAAVRTGAPVAVGSALSVPLPGGVRPFGVLTVERESAFDAGDLHFLQAVAHVLATAKSGGQAEGEPKLAETRIDELERVDAARASDNGADAARSAPALTPREQEVLALIAQGLTNAAIADRLGIGITTVRSHVRGVIEKLGVNSKLQAIVRAREQGLLH